MVLKLVTTFIIVYNTWLHLDIGEGELLPGVIAQVRMYSQNSHVATRLGCHQADIRLRSQRIACSSFVTTSLVQADNRLSAKVDSQYFNPQACHKLLQQVCKYQAASSLILEESVQLDEANRLDAS